MFSPRAKLANSAENATFPASWADAAFLSLCATEEEVVAVGAGALRVTGLAGAGAGFPMSREDNPSN